MLKIILSENMAMGRFHCFLLGFSIFAGLIRCYEGILGVSESQQSLYETREDGKWACLGDAAIALNASQINDGICDCPDGSDEPGTGACGEEAPQFYCENGGFLPRYISQSKVGDGVCDCCDCSDEKLSKGKVFYRGPHCEDLQVSFDKFVKQELEIHRRGLGKLLELKAKARSLGSPKTHEALTEEIGILSEQLSRNEKVLASEKIEYAKKIEEENPMLFEFEQLHVDIITNGINDLFDEIIMVSKAYEDLVKILEALVKNYSAHLKDMVVNENVRKYELYKQSNLVHINCNAKNDNEQREQLLDYFQTELPELFSSGLSDKPIKYVQGKAAFVDMLILGKVEYTEIIVDALDKLRSMLQDVTENYNRNYQDQGVKQAVESFRHYTEKYGSVGVVQLSPNLMDKLDHLKGFVIRTAPKLASYEDHHQEGIAPNGLMQQVQGWVQGIPNFFRPDVKVQIKKHEQDVRSLRAQITNKRKELATLIEGESLAVDERTKQVKALIDAINPHLERKLGSYTYRIQYNGQILQKENLGDQNSAVIGNFKSLRLNDRLALLKYKEYVRNNYSGDDELLQHLISETTDEKEDFLFGNLYQLNNGLQLEFDNGDNCWDGPNRSATVFVQCSDELVLKKITETSRCRYSVEIESPFGCSEDFVYQPFRL